MIRCDLFAISDGARCPEPAAYAVTPINADPRTTLAMCAEDAAKARAAGQVRRITGLRP